MRNCKGRSILIYKGERKIVRDHKQKKIERERETLTKNDKCLKKSGEKWLKPFVLECSVITIMILQSSIPHLGLT